MSKAPEAPKRKYIESKAVRTQKRKALEEQRRQEKAIAKMTARLAKAQIDEKKAPVVEESSDEEDSDMDY